jgi:hypothetical protein
MLAAQALQGIEKINSLIVFMIAAITLLKKIIECSR